MSGVLSYIVAEAFDQCIVERKHPKGGNNSLGGRRLCRKDSQRITPDTILAGLTNDEEMKELLLVSTNPHKTERNGDYLRFIRDVQTCNNGKTKDCSNSKWSVTTMKVGQSDMHSEEDRHSLLFIKTFFVMAYFLMFVGGFI